VTTEPVQRWFFVHMHKTAGTALYQRLHEQFPPEAIYPRRAEQKAHKASLHVDLLCRHFRERGRELRVIAGHFPLCTTELLGVPFTTITVLRDPVERTLSSLRDMREREPIFRGQPLERIYEEPIRFQCLIHSHMVKMLSITPDEMTDGALTALEMGDGHLERAKRNLVERLDAWGVQEHFDEFCAELTQRFGWNLGTPRFANRTKPFDASEVFRERIVRDNALDVELYRYAVELRRQQAARPARSGRRSR
jgi:Galactose-3-O-sulfotransferase